MPIRKESDGEYVCECDNCGDPYYGGVIEDFMEFVRDVQSSGWRVYKDGNGWCHLCPTCTNT